MISQRLLCLYVCLMITSHVWATEPESPKSPKEKTLLKARIGIELWDGHESRNAKLRGERLLADDQYRIYVTPESEDCYVYVVTTDGDVTTIVSVPEKSVTAQGSLRLLPPLNSEPPFYRIPDDSSEFAVSVMCSLAPVPELDELAEQHELSTDVWKALEQQLVKEHTIELPGKLPEKPWTLAGGTRGIPLPPPVATFLEALKISSGNALVLKQYEFQIPLQK